MFASRKRVTDVAQPLVAGQQMPSASNQQKLELAKNIASRINMAKNIGPEAQDETQKAAKAILTGTITNPQFSVRTFVLCIID